MCPVPAPGSCYSIRVSKGLPFLHISCKSGHMCTLSWLTSSLRMFWSSAMCDMCDYLIPHCRQPVLHCMAMPQLVLSVDRQTDCFQCLWIVSWWTFRLFRVWGQREWVCSHHLRKGPCVDLRFHFFRIHLNARLTLRFSPWRLGTLWWNAC